tara:strand:- start:2601 stop:3629 length:1029 start_codon:yes stop_codon:yes gene_type:complete
MRVIHGGFSRPMGGVSPMKQEKMIDPNAGEGSGDAKVGRKKQSDIDYKEGEKKTEKTADQVQDIANFAPIVGELIDGKLLVKDLIAGDYGGAALNAAGFALPFVPGSLVKKGVKKVMDYIRRQPGADDAIKKGTKILDEGGSVGSKPKGGVGGGSKNIINGNEYYKGATHRGTVTDIKQLDNTVADATSTVSRQGKATDNALAKMDFNVATDLKPEHVKKIGTQSGRDIFEVSYPDGTTQKFWQSSGGGNKTVMYKGEEISSEGFFGTVAGHMDNKIPQEQAIARADEMYKRGTKEHAQMIDGLTDNDGYFIKSSGWQGYGSTTYEQTGAALKEMFGKGLIK